MDRVAGEPGTAPTADGARRAEAKATGVGWLMPGGSDAGPSGATRKAQADAIDIGEAPVEAVLHAVAVADHRVARHTALVARLNAGSCLAPMESPTPRTVRAAG